MKALVLLLLACCGSAAPAPTSNTTKPPPNAADRDTCAVAEDCTLIETCCGCSAGGKRLAIRKDAVADYDATRPKRCGDTVCTAVMSDHPSCNAEATCEAGHCKVMAHLGTTP